MKTLPYLYIYWIVVQCAVTDANEPTIFNNLDQSRTIAEGFCGTNNTQQVPAACKSNGLLKTASSYVAYWARPRICQEEDGDAWLLKA